MRTYLVKTVKLHILVLYILVCYVMCTHFLNIFPTHVTVRIPF